MWAVLTVNYLGQVFNGIVVLTGKITVKFHLFGLPQQKKCLKSDAISQRGTATLLFKFQQMAFEAARHEWQCPCG